MNRPPQVLTKHSTFTFMSDQDSRRKNIVDTRWKSEKDYNSAAPPSRPARESTARTAPSRWRSCDSLVARTSLRNPPSFPSRNEGRKAPSRWSSCDSLRPNSLLPNRPNRPLQFLHEDLSACSISSMGSSFQTSYSTVPKNDDARQTNRDSMTQKSSPILFDKNTTFSPSQRPALLRSSSTLSEHSNVSNVSICSVNSSLCSESPTNLREENRLRFNRDAMALSRASGKPTLESGDDGKHLSGNRQRSRRNLLQYSKSHSGRNLMDVGMMKQRSKRDLLAHSRSTSSRKLVDLAGKQRSRRNLLAYSRSNSGLGLVPQKSMRLHSRRDLMKKSLSATRLLVDAKSAEVTNHSFLQDGSPLIH